MKKLFAVILAITLVFSLVACGGGNKEGGNGGNGGGPVVTKGKFETFFDKYLSDGEFSITYEIDSVDSPIECAFSGENIYIHMTSQGYEAIILKNADGMFILMPAMNAYMSMEAAQTDEYKEMTEDPFKISDGLGEFTEGTMEIEGTNYDYEEYIEEEVSTRYLFDGDTLAYIVTGTGTENESIMKVTAVSNDVDDSLFVMPEGYSSF